MDRLEFKYQVKKSARRKTLAISVHQDNRVVVSAPVSCPQRSILQFIENKSDWIRRTILANLQKSRQRMTKRFATGEKLLYLGKEYTLEVERGEHSQVALGGDKISVRLPVEVATAEPSAIKSILFEWYLESALAKIRERIPNYADMIGVNPRSVTVKPLKSRWGSCSAHGRISLAWNIIMAPDDVLDYLVVHELCHLVHHDHSANYWKLVESIIPNHRRMRKWLRENEGLLSF